MKISYYSLGCKVNQYETEAVINKFLENGFSLVDFGSNADVTIINTCSVTKTSDDKSRKIIRRALKASPNAVIAVMGCYAQLKMEDITSIDGVSIVIGTSNRDKLYDLVIEKLTNRDNQIVLKDDILKVKKYEELKCNGFIDKTRAFVKIQDGCNNFCSYCTIPFARGLVRSRKVEDVINELTIMSNDGIKEIVLTGIDTASYGKDFEDYDFADLLTDIVNKVPGLGRIRVSSIEISEVSDKLLNVLKDNPSHFCNHLHIPLQGSSDKVLKRMNRKYSVEEYIAKIRHIREVLGDINITTDILTGFCSEDESDFLNGLEVIKECAFGEMHVFPYSRRERTIAYNYPDQVDENTKHARVSVLLELNDKLARAYRARFIGKEEEVIVEKCVKGYCYGHTSNYLEVKFKGNHRANELVKVIIMDDGYPITLAKEGGEK